MDNATALGVAGFAIVLMFCVWMFIAPFESTELRSPEDDADDQTFTF